MGNFVENLNLGKRVLPPWIAKWNTVVQILNGQRSFNIEIQMLSNDQNGIHFWYIIAPLRRPSESLILIWFILLGATFNLVTRIGLP